MRLLRRRSVSAAVKYACAAATTLTAAYLAGSGADLWHRHAGWIIAAIAIDAAIAFGVSTRAAFYEVTEVVRGPQEQTTRALLEAAWFGVADESGIDPRELLVNLFLIEGTGKRKHLKRYMRVGVRQIPESTVRWTKGKGVIGACWASEAIEHRDITALNVRHGECTTTQWESVPTGTRMGLSFEEWVKTRRKYDMIIAVPVHRDGDLIGCVSVTGPTHDTTWLTDSKVRGALVAAARSIGVATRL